MIQRFDFVVYFMKILSGYRNYSIRLQSLFYGNISHRCDSSYISRGRLLG